MIVTSKHNIKTALSAYGELECAAKVDTLDDEQVLLIGKMAMSYIADNRLVDKTIALASIEYFEGTKRELKKNRRDMSYYKDSKNDDEGFFRRAFKILIKK